MNSAPGALLPLPRPPPARPMPVSFDKSGEACSVCHEEAPDAGEVLECITCGQKAHVACYPQKATTERQWVCQTCDTIANDAYCLLCGQSPEVGIMRLIREDENPAKMRLKLPEGKELGDVTPLAHCFCLRFVQHPQAVRKASKMKCALCDQSYARLQCGHCTTAFHPNCALNVVGVMQHVETGEIVVACQKHSGLPAVSPIVTKEVTAVAAPKPVEVARPTAAVTKVAIPTVHQPPTSTSDFIPDRRAWNAKVAAPVSKTNGKLVLSSASSNAQLLAQRAKAAGALTAPPLVAASAAAASTTKPHKPASSDTAVSPARPLVESAKDQFMKTFVSSSESSGPKDKENMQAKRHFISGENLSTVRSPHQLAATAKSPKPPRPPKPHVDVASVSKFLGRSKHTSGVTERRQSPSSSSSSSSSDDDTPLVTSKVAGKTDKKLMKGSRSKSSSPDEKAQKSKRTKLTKAPSPSSSSSSSSSSSMSSSSSSSSDEDTSKHLKRQKQKERRSSSSSPEGSRLKKKRRCRPPQAVSAAKSSKHKASMCDSPADEDVGELELGSDPLDSLDLRIRSEEMAKRRQEAAQAEVDATAREEKEMDPEACCVCGKEDQEWYGEHHEDNDEMVFCEGPCQRWYHQSCGGIPTVPGEGIDWFCRACSNGYMKEDKLRCVICGSEEFRGFCEVKYSERSLHYGSKKKQFAHLLCVFWTHETSFGRADAGFRYPALGVEDVPKWKQRLTCKFCTRQTGAKLPCSEKECVQAFHPLCMLRHPDECFADTHEWDNDIEDEHGRKMRPPKEQFCPHHSRKRFLIRTRDEMLEKDPLADVAKINQEIDDFDAKTIVNPTIALMKPTHMVRNPHRTGRSKHVEIEVDPTDQEQRAEKSRQRMKAKEEQLKEGEDADVDMTKVMKKSEHKVGTCPESPSDSEMSDSTRGMSGLTKSRKRKAVSSDADDRMEIDDEASDAAGKKQKQAAEVSIAATGASPVKLKKRSSSPVLASTHPLSTSYVPWAAGHVSSLDSNENVRVRSNARTELKNKLLGDLEVANHLEEVIFQVCDREVGKAYRQKLRDLLFNLGDPENTAFRQQVLDASEADTLQDVVRMTNAEMAPTRVRQRRKSIQEEALADATITSTSVYIKPGGERAVVDVSSGKAVRASSGDTLMRDSSPRA